MSLRASIVLGHGALVGAPLCWHSCSGSCRLSAPAPVAALTTSLRPLHPGMGLAFAATATTPLAASVALVSWLATVRGAPWSLCFLVDSGVRVPDPSLQLGITILLCHLLDLLMLPLPLVVLLLGGGMRSAGVLPALLDFFTVYVPLARSVTRRWTASFPPSPASRSAPLL